jgi:putative transcription factor
LIGSGDTGEQPEYVREADPRKGLKPLNTFLDMRGFGSNVAPFSGYYYHAHPGENMTGSEPVQCEMCGTETADPNRIKVEGAELDVCDECTDFGTELNTGEDSSSTSTKYSTSDSSSSTGGSGSSRSTSTGTTSTGGGGGGGRSTDIYEDVDELAQNFDAQIRNARERADLTQAELAQQLNEKASLIRKLERGETLPTDNLQSKLEGHLDIDLTAGGSMDTDEWDSDSSTGEYTLGDMVERED